MDASQHSDTVAYPIVKALSLWALIGVTSWADLAAFLGACYSLLLIGEWVWKKFKGRRDRARNGAAKNGKRS